MREQSTVGHQEFGDPAAPVLVTSPSLGQHPDMWAGQVDAFAARFRLIMLEHRGHAGDPPPGPYTLDDIGADALRTLDALGVGEFSFCGLSLGGMTGMWLASEVPDRVRALALCCTSAHLPPVQMWRDRAATVRADGMAAVADRVVVRWFTAGFVHAHPEVVAAGRQSLLRTPAEGYAGCCEAIATMDLRDRLPAITARTLVLAGADDPVTPPSPHAETIAAGIPGAALVVVPDASHLAPLARPEACTPLLLDHLLGDLEA